jgi:hypothetical protein
VSLDAAAVAALAEHLEGCQLRPTRLLVSNVRVPTVGL